MKITFTATHLITLVVIIAIAIGAVLAYSNVTSKTYYAVEASDGRILVGDLKGNTLCHYLQLSAVIDPKTKQKSINTAPGGQVYGGDGCLIIKSSSFILTEEKIAPGTPMYTQLQTVR
jgi:hypothetical protein